MTTIQSDNTTRPPPARADDPTAPLRAIRDAAKRRLIVQGVATVLAAAIAAVVAMALIDYAVRLPASIRAIALVAGLVVLAYMCRKRVLPALGFRPPLVEIALRLEQIDTPARVELTRLLASGVDFSEHPHPEDRRSIALRRHIVARAADALANVRTRDAVDSRAALSALSALAIALATPAAIWITAPASASIGAARVLAPWSGAVWPKRTTITDYTALSVAPADRAIPIRAGLMGADGAELSSGAAQRGVSVRYTLLRTRPDASPIATRVTQTVPLTRQAALAIEADIPDGSAVYERLLEPAGLIALARAQAEPMVDQWILEYALVSDDDESEPVRVRLVDPPAITGASASIEPPAYAVEAGIAEPRRIDLGSGADDRAVPRAVLAGASIEVEIRLNKPLPEQSDPEAWIDATLGSQAALMARTGALRAALEGDRVRAAFTLATPTRLDVRLVDGFGIASRDTARYLFTPADDRSPTVILTTPRRDLSVTPDAVVNLRAEASDDLALASVELIRQSEVGPEMDEPEAIAAQGASGGARRLIVDASLDLTPLDLPPGSAVRITAIARDAFDASGAARELAVSAPRILRVVDDAELTEQLWDEIDAVRRGAMRLDADQERLMREAAREPSGSRVAGAQSRLTERLAQAGERIDEIRDRAASNRIDDPSMDGLLDAAQSALESAQRESAEAAGSLAKPERTDDDAMDTKRAQQNVRDRLNDVARLLDQGKDTWAVERSIERLAEMQRDLTERASDATSDLAGADLQQLSAEDRAALGSLAAEQAALADRLEEALETIARIEPLLRQEDPAAAEALAEAARRAQRQEAEENMRDAAEDLEGNRGSSARARQEEAAAALEEMLEAIQEAQQNRDEVLRRVLSELIDAVRALAEDQSALLAAVQGSADESGFRAMSQRQAALHKRTLSALAQAAGGPREARIVTDDLDAAAEAQSTATLALGDSLPNRDEALDRQRVSLDRLEAALATLEALDAEAEDRQREEAQAKLRAAYEQALTDQRLVRTDTAQLAERERSRRRRAVSRDLAGRQGVIADALDQLRVDNDSLRAASVFDFAHDRLDTVMRRAADALRADESGPRVLDDQDAAISVLTSLLDALEMAQQQNNFRQNATSPSAGGDQQQQQGDRAAIVPELAELRVLRAMQADAFDLTRRADEPDAPDDLRSDAAVVQKRISEEAAELLQRIQQQNAAPPPSEQPDGEPDAGDEQ